MTYKPSFIDEWLEEFDSWNYYVNGWFPVGVLISTLLATFFSISGNQSWWVLFLSYLIILLIIPILCTFFAALKIHRWKIKNYKETGEKYY